MIGGILAGGLVLAFTANAAADPEVAGLDATLAPGSVVRVSVRGVLGAHGTLSVLARLRSAAEVPLELALPASADAITLRSVEVSGGMVAHLRASAGTVAQEAIVGLHRGRPAVVWMGITGLRGDPGERTGKALAFEDLTGDGLPEVVLSDLNEAVRLCGVATAPLFPRAYDPAGGRFRPILLNRLRALSTSETAIDARWDTPGPTGAPLATIATFTSTSSSQGDGEDPMRLAPPLALGDGNLETAWAEGRGGDGRGEFATAALSSAYRVRAVGIVVSSPGTPADARRSGRPKGVTLVLDDRKLRVSFPGDPADRPGETLWIVLPIPVSARCLSVVMGESLPAQGARPPDAGATRIAEVRVYSDLDFGGGAEQLVGDLRQPGARADDAARLLATMGPAGAAALARVLPTLERRSRVLAARALADIHDAGTIPMLRGLLADPDDAVRGEAVRAFAAMGDAALAPLREELAGRQSRAKAAAASALGRLGTVASLEVLMGHAGSGGSEERRAVRDAIGSCLALSGQAGTSALTNVLLGAGGPGAATKMELIRVLDLGSPGARDLAVRALEALGDPGGAFGPRFHRLRLMGKLCELGERRFAPELARAASPGGSAATDDILHAEAVSAIGSCGPASVLLLRGRLDDRSVRVRAAAVDALKTAADGGAAARIARVARRDRWPFLRSRALEALVALDPSSSRATVSAALHDAAASVRRIGIQIAVRLDLRAASADVADRAGDANEEADVRTDAVYALGQLCARRHVDVIKRIARMGLRPDATDLEMTAAGAAVEALGRIGGPVAAEELRAARRQSSPPLLRLAAERALRGHRCEAARH